MTNRKKRTNYTEEQKKEWVAKYEAENLTMPISRTRFALKNGLTQSSFNLWCIKYETI